MAYESVSTLVPVEPSTFEAVVGELAAYTQDRPLRVSLQTVSGAVGAVAYIHASTEEAALTTVELVDLRPPTHVDELSVAASVKCARLTDYGVELEAGGFTGTVHDVGISYYKLFEHIVAHQRHVRWPLANPFAAYRRMLLLASIAV